MDLAESACAVGTATRDISMINIGLSFFLRPYHFEIFTSLPTFPPIQIKPTMMNYVNVIECRYTEPVQYPWASISSLLQELYKRVAGLIEKDAIAHSSC